jgi:predicted nucleic acid-binding Zn ribbon protein
MTNKPEIPTKLFCQVCGQAIPDEKTKRRSNTCGEKECVNALRRFRASLSSAGKCPYCYHPSTPEEWERYRKWRRWEANQNDTTMQAFIKAPNGMTLRAIARKLAKSLCGAAQLAEARRRLVLEQSTLKKGGAPDLATLPEEAGKEIAQLDDRILEWGQLLDMAKGLLPEKSVDAKAPE